MATFIFIYRNPARYVPTPETSAEMRAWFDGMGNQLVELGRPVLASDTAGNLSPGTTDLELNGYSIVAAEDLAAAVAIARKCPHLARNGGIEVGELGEVPAPGCLTA